MESFHQLPHGVSGGPPLGLVAEDDRVAAETGELGHRGDDEVVLVLPAAAAIERTRDEIAPDEIEGGRPAAYADSGAFPKRLQVVVITDGMLVVLMNVAGKVQAMAGSGCTGEAAVVIRRAVADGTDRELDVGGGLGPERTAAAAAERARRRAGGRAA